MLVKTIFGKETFDWIQGQSEEVPRKPDPAGALAIMKRLECLSGGMSVLRRYQYGYADGPWSGDFYRGSDLGLSARSELEQYHADRIIDSPLEILDFSRACRRIGRKA